MKNILVTAIGSFAADIVIKNLLKDGYNVVGCDIYPKEWIVDAYSVKKFYRVSPVREEDCYYADILSICQENDINYIVPLTDVEVDFYNSYRKQFSDLGVCVCISNKEVIDLVRNKKKLEEYLKCNTAVNTIPTEYVKKIHSDNLKFPVICKPDNGRSSQGIKVIKTLNQWEDFIEHEECDNYIVQPFLKGNVITVDIINQPKQDRTVAIAREELLRTLNGAGTSVKVFNDENLLTECKMIAKKLQLCGCVNFEFIKVNNKDYYFLECNPRFSGGVEFSCMAGYDCIKNHLRCFQDSKIEDFDTVHSMYIARKFEEYVTCED